VSPAARPSDPAASAHYLSLAQATQAHTVRHLAYYGGGADVAAAPWIAYRRSTAEPDYSDSWYDFSQVQADATLVARGLPAYEPYVAKAFRHLEQHWDAVAGGYFGRGGIRGDWVGGPDKYADDNALAGLALLAAHASARDPAARAQYLTRARAVAVFLVGGTLWDGVFDGGFWWNTRRGDTVEGKPAQSNGLAALFFFRLHACTGEARWREWAARTLAWLDAHLWDAQGGLYRYCVRYADPARRQGRAVELRYFNYDQGILLELWALLAHAAALGSRPAAPAMGQWPLPASASALARARTIGMAVDARFWDAALGGYVLEAGVPQVFLIYAAWLTPALLALAAADPDPRWVALARRNSDTLHAVLYDAAGGYAHRAWRDGAAIRRDLVRHTAAQAWMQYAQAALARALA
jgi:hypothetical protein